MAYTLATPKDESNNNKQARPTFTTDYQTNRPSPSQQQEPQRAYVIALVDVTVHAIATIWPNTSNAPSQGPRPVAQLDQFLHHILKHSRTTHSTLQLAIFYLFRVRPQVIERRHENAYIGCGRRMFLAALICAHKFLQDKTYSNMAWSKVSGLSVAEVNHAERVMLQLLDWSLFVKKETYDQWIKMLQSHLKCRIPFPPPPPSSIDCAGKKNLSGKIPTISMATTANTNNDYNNGKPSIPAIKPLLVCGMPTPPVDSSGIHALPCMTIAVDNSNDGSSLLPSPPDDQHRHNHHRKRKLLDDGDDNYLHMVHRERRPRHAT